MTAFVNNSETYYYDSKDLQKDAQYLVREESKRKGFKVKLAFWSIGLPRSSGSNTNYHLVATYCGINPKTGDTVGGQLTMAI